MLLVEWSNGLKAKIIMHKNCLCLGVYILICCISTIKSENVYQRRDLLDIYIPVGIVVVICKQPTMEQNKHIALLYLAMKSKHIGPVFTFQMNNRRKVVNIFIIIDNCLETGLKEMVWNNTQRWDGGIIHEIWSWENRQVCTLRRYIW